MLCARIVATFFPPPQILRTINVDQSKSKESSLARARMSSPEDARLAALSRELDAAVARINALQGGGGGKGGAAAGAESSSQHQAVNNSAASSTSTSSSSNARKPPFRARASSHLARHGNRLTSALLAGCAFAVAAGRLSDARERREAEAGWEAERAEREGRAEAAEAALREAMLRLRGSNRSSSSSSGGGGGGGEGGSSGGGGGGGGGSRWSWLLPSSSRRQSGGGGAAESETLSSSPPPPPPPPLPPKPRMI